MRINARCLLLPLFCLSLSLSSCNTKENEIKSYVENNLVNMDIVDNINVRKVTNNTTEIYMIYAYYKVKDIHGNIHYKIDVFVYDNGRYEWVYSV